MKSGTCKHFTGIQKKCCSVGIEYKPKELPCIKRFANGATCEKFEEPSAEEVAAEEKEIQKLIAGMATARKAILEELKKRHESGDIDVKLNKHCNGEVEDGPKNFFSGCGVMVCPVCAGKLHYRRAAYNGHVHARCETNGCVAWME